MRLSLPTLLLSFCAGSALFSLLFWVHYTALPPMPFPMQLLLPGCLGGLAAIIISIFRAKNLHLQKQVRKSNEWIAAQKKQTIENHNQLFRIDNVIQLLINPDTQLIEDANSAALAFYGYPLDTLIQAPLQLLDSTPESERTTFIQEVNSQTQHHCRARHRLCSGEFREMEIYAAPLHLLNQRVIRLILFDTAARDVAEAKLRRKTLEQRLLLDSIPVQIWFLRDPETFGMVNTAYAEHYGLSPKQIAHKPLDSILPRPLLMLALASNRQVFSERKALHYEQWVHREGCEPRYMAIIKTPKLDAVGNVEFVVCSATDITRIQQVRTLLQLERDLHMALSGATSFNEALHLSLIKAFEASQTDCGALYLANEDGSFTLAAWKDLSQEYLATFNHLPKDSVQARLIIRKKPVYATGNDTTHTTTPKNMQLMQREGLLATGLIPIVSQGKIRACLFIASRQLANIPEYNRMAVERVAVDVGALLIQKEQDSRLLRHQQNLETLFNSIQDFVFILDFQGILVYLNPAAAEGLGYTQRELIGTSLLNLHPPDVQKKAQTILDEAVAQKNPRAFLPLIARNGSLLPVETNMSTGHWSEQPVIFSLSRDISARVRFEKQQQLLLKTEGLERMAGALAHTLNNLLTVVMGNLEMALTEHNSREHIQEQINNALQGCQQATELGRSLLLYTGQSFESNQTLDLAQFCRQQIHDLQQEWPEQLVLHIDCPLPGPQAHLSPALLQQTIKALLSNAVESIGEQSGEISIASFSYDGSLAPEEHIFPANWQPQQGRYACLEVTDNGSGIEETQVTNIFDPFYSDKFLGRGLGLSIALSFVKHLGGAISVQSKRGQGSVFRIIIPAAVRSATQEPTKTP